MKHSVSKIIFIVIFILLLLCGGNFLLANKTMSSDKFEIVIIGKNEYQSILEVKLKNTDLTIKDFDFQWWYKDVENSNDKNLIEGATSYKYKIEDGLVGKYIGVNVIKKNSLTNLTYEDITDSYENVTTTVSAIESTIDLKNKVVSYNGNTISIDDAGISSDAIAQYTYYTDNLCSIKTNINSGAAFDGDAPIDAGVYYVKAEILDSPNYKAASSECVELRINPLDVSVSWSALELKYNGQKQGPSASVVNSVTAEQVNVSFISTVNAGNYVSEAECVSVSGGRDKCSNFNLVNDTKEYNIGLGETSIHLTEKRDVYSGDAVNANEAISSSDGEITYTYYIDSACTKMTTSDVGVSVDGGAPIDAGQYYVIAKVKETGNMSSASTGCISHVIEPKVLTVTWGNSLFTYDGGNKSPVASTITEIGDEVVVFNTGVESKPGIYSAQAICSNVNGGRRKCSNYWFSNDKIDFTINKAIPNVSLAATSVLYDGDPVYAKSVITNSSGDVSYSYYLNSTCTTPVSSDVALSVGGAPIDAGNYYVKAFVGESDYYTSGESGCVSHIINKVTVTATGGSSYVSYSGDEYSIGFSSKYSRVGNEAVSLNTVKGITPGSYSSDAYCVSVSGGRSKCSNYKVLTTEKANVYIDYRSNFIDFVSTSMIYNGNPANPSIRTANDSSSYKFFSDSSCTNQIEAPIDVGTYYVKGYGSTADYYKYVTTSCTKYVINKQSKSVSWNTAERLTYNGKEQAPKAYIMLNNGEEYVLETDKFINAGKHTSSVISDISIYPLSNFDLSNTSKDFSIYKATPDIFAPEIVTLSTATKVINFSVTEGYDGQILCSSSTSVSCEVDGRTVKFTALRNGTSTISLDGMPTDNYNSANSAKISVTVEKGGYDINYYDDSGNLFVNDNVNAGTNYKVVKEFEKEGFNFLGWSTSIGGTVKYKINSTFMVFSKVDLYPVLQEIVPIHENFDDDIIDSDLAIFVENGSYQIVDGKLKIVNDELSDTVTGVKFEFCPEYDSYLSFDYGKNYIFGSVDDLIINLNGSDGSTIEVVTNSNLENFDDAVKGISLISGVQYSLELSYSSNNIIDNYVYIDNLKVEIVDTTIQARVDDGQFSLGELVTSFSNMVTSLCNKFIEFILNLFN